MSERPRHSSHLTAWIVSILLVPVLYLASVPWVAAYSNHRGAVLEWYYGPCRCISNNSPIAEELLGRYEYWVSGVLLQ
jgi:hypothetical protein